MVNRTGAHSLSITTFNVKTLSITINAHQHEWLSAHRHQKLSVICVVCCIFIVILDVIILNITLLNVIMLNVISEMSLF
jgi:hypothetical protein